MMTATAVHGNRLVPFTPALSHQYIFPGIYFMISAIMAWMIYMIHGDLKIFATVKSCYSLIYNVSCVAVVSVSLWITKAFEQQ